jgi:Flp pilus assembly protein TadB
VQLPELSQLFIIGLAVLIVGGLALAVWLDRRIERSAAAARQVVVRDVAASRPTSFILTYRGHHGDAARDFAAEARAFDDMGYLPVSLSWAAGEWSLSAFVAAILLVFFYIGVLVLLYMLIIKPSGTLMVVYAVAPP